MLNKIIAASPVTPSREAVQSLVSYHNDGQKFQEMPDFYRLKGEIVLVLNNKKYAYYVTTPKMCSCPEATYHPWQPCKHGRKYFHQPKKSQAVTEVESDALLGAHNAGARRLAWPVDSIRPNIKAFRPFDTLPSEERTKGGDIDGSRDRRPQKRTATDDSIPEDR
jgi:hypothetical protein